MGYSNQKELAQSTPIPSVTPHPNLGLTRVTTLSEADYL